MPLLFGCNHCRVRRVGFYAAGTAVGAASAVHRVAARAGPGIAAASSGRGARALSMKTTGSIRAEGMLQLLILPQRQQYVPLRRNSG